MINVVSQVILAAQTYLEGFITPYNAQDLNHSFNGYSTECNSPMRWLTQSIDHFGQSNASFQQRYGMHTEFYKPGGPIFLFQGEESVSLDCVESTIMYDFARKMNGLAVVLEHRYFGKSKPFGDDLASYTSEQWKFLTLDNVMKDAVFFIDEIKANISGAHDSAVFAASGSYGGFLMTMFRQNYPDTFTGVIASAPPLRTFYGENDGDVSGQYNWWNYVGKIYHQESAQAAKNIENSFQHLAQRFLNNSTSTLHLELGLCDPVTDNLTETHRLLSTYLRQVFANAVEFNYNIVRPGRSPLALPLEKFVDIAIKENDPIQILNQTNWLWYTSTAKLAGMTFNCIDIHNFTEMAKLTAPLIEAIPFEYITCTYLSIDGFSGSPALSIFPPTGNPAKSHANHMDYCSRKYGRRPPPANEMYRRYHFTDSDLQSSTGIIFSLAEYDPTTAISGLYHFTMPLPADPYASRRLIANGMAHREDLFSMDEDTKSEVEEYNKQVLEILKGWEMLSKRARS